MSAYSIEEKLKKDKLYHEPLREELEVTDKQAKSDKGQGFLQKRSEAQTMKLTNYFSSFSAGAINDWEGDKKTAVIKAKRDFRHRTPSFGEKNVNLTRKSSLYPGARRAFVNNVNKEKSAVYLKETDIKTTPNLILGYKKLVEKSSNLALKKSLSFLSKKTEKEELSSIMANGLVDQKRVNYLRDVMNLKDQRSLEFKNKLIKAENMKPTKRKKRDFDILKHLSYVSFVPASDIKKKDSNEEVDPNKNDPKVTNNQTYNEEGGI